jgi:hypothetical protein
VLKERCARFICKQRRSTAGVRLLAQRGRGYAWRISNVVPREPLVGYTEDLLRVQPHHVQRRAQLTLTVSGSGVIESFTLAHYVAPYFRSDAELRAAVLSNASVFNWHVAPYRAVSKLIGLAPEGSRARCYISFTVSRRGDARFDSYVSSARLFSTTP